MRTGVRAGRPEPDDRLGRQPGAGVSVVGPGPVQQRLSHWIMLVPQQVTLAWPGASAAGADRQDPTGD